MSVNLFEKLQSCNREEEVKYEFARYFDLALDTEDDIDLYTREILFEFKYDIKMKSVLARSKPIAQALYYIRRLKYGQDNRVPSNYICVVDKNEAVLIETDKLKDYYFLSKADDYDWDLAPSNPCKKLVTALSNSEEVKNLHVYNFSDSESLNDFVQKIRDYSSGGVQLSLFGNKKVINELNFYSIFKYWQSLFGRHVENGRKSSEYFITDIEQGRSSEMDGQILFRMNSGEYITKYLPLSEYRYFWDTYEKINDVQEVAAIRQKMDRMSEKPLRKKTGEYYTSLPFAEKAIHYIGRTVGMKWWTTGKYRLWDMAAGTGNLEYSLPAEALRYCYISSLLADDVEYCAKIFPESTVFQYDYLNDDVNFLVHPELVSMGVMPKLPQSLLKDLNNPEIKWILFFNPPYATGNENSRQEDKAGKSNVSMTEVRKLMDNAKMGEVSRELYSQFLYRISMEFSGKQAYIAMFSKIKYINANNDQLLRDKFFQYEFKRGFVFSSKAFEGCKANFPVAFIIWDMKKKKHLEKQHIIVDVYNEKVEKYGMKEIFVNRREAFLNDWMCRERTTHILPPLSSAITVAGKNKDRRDRAADGFLASLMCNGNDFGHQNYTSLLSSPYVSAGATSITANNFEQAMIIHTVRRLPKADWLNDRDQFMQPNCDVFSDREFVTDCVVWSLFSGSNETASMSNVVYENNIYRIQNNFFPFLLAEIKEWNYDNSMIKNQVFARQTDRFAAGWIAKQVLSNEGKYVLNAGAMVYKFFYENYNKVDWPRFQIRDWDAGWWQIRRSLTEAGLGVDLLENCQNKHKILGDKILPKLYQYDFIKPSIQEVNK